MNYIVEEVNFLIKSKLISFNDKLRPPKYNTYSERQQTQTNL